MRFLITLAAASAVAATAAPALADTAIPDGTTLDVTATGKIVRTPDIATIRAGVVTQAPTAAAALSENAARMARVIQSLKGAGIAERDIMTSNVGLSPQYRYQQNEAPVITGYQANNNVSVKFRDIAKSGAALDALVKAGANQIDGPSMSVSKPESALDEARGEAVRIARARAELYAKAAGLRVVRIISINENGENEGNIPRPVMYARVAAAPAADSQIMAGETDLSVTVAVRFLLQ
ncbi:SIMPL domain-containing protein [uncultured Sphingomonas sp.]|mgnify:FL=1|uniref:SIMPL domain-containing protein n=1 Tax=uncultured Sphingomonas sp. TaxID=158754 RepID=UPI002604306B|nr:SIMPL domain-containing protein [uncultured Sphingomonas sp.]